MSNHLSNLQINTKSLQIKCFVKKVGGTENNNGVKVIVQSNFRLWSHENASPFSYNQITRRQNLDQGLQGAPTEEGLSPGTH